MNSNLALACVITRERNELAVCYLSPLELVVARRRETETLCSLRCQKEDDGEGGKERANREAEEIRWTCKVEQSDGGSKETSHGMTYSAFPFNRRRSRTNSTATLYVAAGCAERPPRNFIHRQKTAGLLDSKATPSLSCGM